MTRKHVPLEQRKISLTLSLPYPLWLLGKDKGSRHMVDLLLKGMWANKVGVNELTLNQLKEDYEEKIMKLQEIIEDGQKN